MRFLAVIEKDNTSWGAHVPDLRGCVPVADTRDGVLDLIREAIDFHLEGMRDHGEEIPEPASEGELIEVGAA